jgi:hypothetical protein
MADKFSHWFADAFGRAAVDIVGDIVGDVRDKLVFEGWFGRSPEHQGNDLGWSHDHPNLPDEPADRAPDQDHDIDR